MQAVITTDTKAEAKNEKGKGMCLSSIIFPMNNQPCQSDDCHDDSSGSSAVRGTTLHGMAKDILLGWHRSLRTLPTIPTFVVLDLGCTRPIASI